MAPQERLPVDGRTPRARSGRESQVPGLPGLDDETPVYVISVAATLSGMHPQTLRQYDRMGLVSPGRTSGGGRRYSARDIALLRQVQQLTASGMGLEGVRRVLELENQVEALRHRVRELEEELASERGRRGHGQPSGAGAPLGTADPSGGFVPVPGSDLVPLRRSTSLVVWRPDRRRR